ncbi:MAG: rRNA maturation RNase YbeY [Cyclobacteriaceae bacterium]|nr:rRNA maturation RNase YbeY [Cyclobacteriaceae bacterium]
MAKINFFTDGISFNLIGKKKIRDWLTLVANENGRTITSINYIFTSDVLLLDLNKKYLNHTTLTDIITFNQSTSLTDLEADIYISIERVGENAIKFKIRFVDELHRVMVHGLLHLIGFNDKVESEKKRMRNSENHYLVLLAQV